jgi:uncharacterized protein YggU (UPF0235/DUF167 family)
MVRLVLRAQPGARREGFCGWFGDLPKFAVRARAIDGAANEALERGVSDALGLPRRSVRLVGGASSRTKRFDIEGVDEAELDRAIERLNPR